jgi:FKBP-type peptidyl-prolyl cis-trans isomerase (trigger factor)
MKNSELLLNAYYEALYELLESNKSQLVAKVDQLLRQEISKQSFQGLNEDKYDAYRDACLAFIDERIESYNPVGFQYTFDSIRSAELYDLELQLNWYDSRTEFEALLDAIRSRAMVQATDERLREVAEELIKQFGAFPDRSIIIAYEADPSLDKLPDYIVSLSIEEIVR